MQAGVKWAVVMGMLSLSMFSIAGEALPEIATGSVIDCSDATTEVEKRICSNPELMALDIKLSEVYAEAQTELAGVDGEPGQQMDPLVKEHAIWLRARDRCKSNACLHSSYIRRIKYIERHWLHR